MTRVNTDISGAMVLLLFDHCGALWLLASGLFSCLALFDVFSFCLVGPVYHYGSPQWGGEVCLFCFSLYYCLCTVRHNLFTLPFPLVSQLGIVGSIIYNRIIVYTPIFFNVVVHVIIIDQSSQTAHCT